MKKNECKGENSDQAMVEKVVKDEEINKENSLEEDKNEDDKNEDDKNEDEDEDISVYEKTIKKKKYYITDDNNNFIFIKEKNGDIGEKIGKLINGKASFF